MLKSEGVGKYTTYNRYNNHDEQKEGIDLTTDILDNGNNIFLCGFYIPVVN
jgi:hypothetical protein